MKTKKTKFKNLVILKGLNVIFKDSEIFHFSDLIFHIQNTKTKKKFRLNSKIILIDEFYINNLTNLILFKKFFFESFHKNDVSFDDFLILEFVYFDPMIFTNVFVKIEVRVQHLSPQLLPRVHLQPPHHHHP